MGIVLKCTVVYGVHKKKKLFWRLQRTTRQVPPVEEETRTEDPKKVGEICALRWEMPHKTPYGNRSTECVLGTFDGATLVLPVLRLYGVYFCRSPTPLTERILLS